MEVELSRQAFHRALQRLAPVVSSKSAAPGNASLRLQATAEGVTLTCGGPGSAMQATLSRESREAVVHRPGSAIVSPRYLMSIVRCLPDGVVSLHMGEGFMLRVKGGGASFQLCGMDPGDYPDAACPLPLHTIDMANHQLKTLVKRLVFALSVSDTRPILTGVSCRIEADLLTFTATDGIRLSVQTLSRTAPARADAFAPLNAVIPGRPLQEFADLLDEEGSTEIRLDSRSIRFTTGAAWLQLALLEGSYPALDRIAVQNFTTFLEVHAVHVLQALERVILLAEAHRLVSLKISGDGPAMLSAQADGIGNVEQELPVLAVRGQPLTIAFNGSYMKAMMRASGACMLRLAFSGPRKPIIVTPVVDPTGWFALTPIQTASSTGTMPVRVNEPGRP